MFHRAGEGRKTSVHSNGSSGEHMHSNEGSPVSSPRRGRLYCFLAFLKLSLPQILFYRQSYRFRVNFADVYLKLM